MLSYRFGLLLLTLLLAACSTPSSQQSTNQADHSTSGSFTENTQTDVDDTKVVLPTTEADHIHTTPSQINPDNLITTPALLVDKKLISEMNTEHQLAVENHQTLLHAMGPEKAPELPRNLTTEQLTDSLVQQKILELQTFNSQAKATLGALTERAKQRKSSEVKGDHVQIFFSEISIQHPDNGFNAQPLVGQWVRGEQRSIRLNNNFLIDPPLSETLSVTFSESYQVLLNGQLIVSIDPNREKSDASFTVNTVDQQGQVTGKLGYRIITP